MARTKKGSLPKYGFHKQSNQAVVYFARGDGTYECCLLGDYGTSESRAEYDRLISEWLENGRRVTRTKKVVSLTVAEICVKFLQHAEIYYRDRDGDPTSELDSFKRTVRRMRTHFAATLAEEFGKQELKFLMKEMIDEKHVRKSINGFANRVRGIFKWAYNEDMAPVEVLVSLQSVSGLKEHRSEAVESEPVLPVAESVFLATIPHLTPMMRDLLLFCRWTGARPSEACRVNWGEIDASSPVWQYRPKKHKNEWRNQERIVPLGPKVQALLAIYRLIPPGESIFSPRRAMKTLWEEQRAGRKSPLTKKQKVRTERRKITQFNETYTPSSVDSRLTKVCKKFGIEKWSMNQLRHLRAEEIEQTHGIEAAAAILGHKHIQTTRVYSRRNAALANKVAGEAG